MARVTVEDCLVQEENRFALVVIAARRARRLLAGETPLTKGDNKASVMALREIAANHVRYSRPVRQVIIEWLVENGHNHTGS